MSDLFAFKGAKGAGYAQPAPLSDDFTIPSALQRSTRNGMEEGEPPLHHHTTTAAARRRRRSRSSTTTPIQHTTLRYITRFQAALR